MRKPLFFVALLALPACSSDMAGDRQTATDGDTPEDSQPSTGDTPTAAALLADCFPNWSFNPEVDHRPGSPQLEDHLAFLNLLQEAMITHSAVRSGPWEDPGTWSGSHTPSAGAVVDIP